jgi:hypothetical protein
MQNINDFIARKLINQTNMLTNIEHRIKNTPRFLSHLKQTNLQQLKENSKTPTPKKLNQEAKAKNKPIKLHKEIITKLTKLFSPIQITNEN